MKLWAEAFEPNQAVLDVVEAIHERATTAILTNNGPLPDFMLRELFIDVAARFDHLCFSYQVCAIKPDREAYTRTLDRLGYAADRCVFIDDSDRNVRGALEAGIDALRFTSAVNLDAALRQRRLW